MTHAYAPSWIMASSAANTSISPNNLSASTLAMNIGWFHWWVRREAPYNTSEMSTPCHPIAALALLSRHRSHLCAIRAAQLGWEGLRVYAQRNGPATHGYSSPSRHVPDRRRAGALPCASENAKSTWSGVPRPIHATRNLRSGEPYRTRREPKRCALRCVVMSLWCKGDPYLPMRALPFLPCKRWHEAGGRE